MHKLEPPKSQKPDRPPNEFDVQIHQFDGLKNAGYPRFAAVIGLLRSPVGIKLIGLMSGAVSVVIAIFRFS